MSFLTRALRAIRYYKRNTILLFLIFTILFSLILSGLCVWQASVETARRTGIEVGGSVLVNVKEGRLSLESAQKIAAHPAVQEARLESTCTACIRNGFRPLSVQYEDVEDTGKDITLLAGNGIHSILRTECRIQEGARPKEGETGYALVHSWVAQEWDVQVGDTILIAPERQGDEGMIELTVIGIYYRDTGYHFGSADGYVENTLFVDMDTVAAISGDTGLYGAEYVIHDPADIPSFLNDIEDMGLPERSQIGLVPLDGDYRKIALSMDSIVAVAALVFGAAIVLGAILLTALVMLSLSSREFEIGVLLSMGEDRGKVILQLAIETLVPVLLGVTAGVLVSMQTASFAADMLGAAAQGVQVGVETWAIGVVYLCGVGLTLLASCVTAYKVLRFQPKKLLLTME